jgi:hypothetical protein
MRGRGVLAPRSPGAQLLGAGATITLRGGGFDAHRCVSPKASSPRLALVWPLFHLDKPIKWLGIEKRFVELLPR